MFNKEIIKYQKLYITYLEWINCRFDLAFYYYLVSYQTTCVQHSSDKFKNANLHCRIATLLYMYYYKIKKWVEIFINLKVLDSKWQSLKKKK